jgi:hypothetical protein
MVSVADELVVVLVHQRLHFAVEPRHLVLQRRVALHQRRQRLLANQTVAVGGGTEVRALEVQPLGLVRHRAAAAAAAAATHRR